MIGDHYRHKKSGGTYTVLGQAGSKIAFKDMEEVTLYITPNAMLLRRSPPIRTIWFLLSVTIQRSSKIDLPASWVVYQSHHDNSVWARPTAEFLDGRFKKVVENSN